MVVVVVVLLVVDVLVDELAVDSEEVDCPCVLDGRSLLSWLLATSPGVGRSCWVSLDMTDDGAERDTELT